MSECYVHEKLRRVDSPCPYCALAELRKENERLRAEKLDILRGNFTQVCSYCGFEAQPPNGWDELQKHIVECTEHPLTALRARCEAAEKELAAERGKVEKQYELIDFYDAKVAAVMKWRESAYIPDDSDENELKRILLGE